MALIDFLYRCPACGAEPLEGRGPAVRCAGGCGRSFRPTRDRSAFHIEGQAGSEGTMTPAEARAAIAAFGGALSRAESPDGALRDEARVQMRLADREEPVHYRGRVLGWFERFGPARSGRLRLRDGSVLFVPDERAGASSRGYRWDLDDVRALQSSSSTVQISLPDDQVVLFRFPADSSRRWEELLQEAVRRLWRAADRGEIAEFQPRIRAR